MIRVFRPRGVLHRHFTLVIACLLVPAACGQVIVDNADAGFTELAGAWTSGSYGSPYGTDYVFAMSASTPTAVCEWLPTLPSAGWYQVSVYYVSGSNRAVDAPYTVYHATGSATSYVNQQVNGSTWVVIGSYYFDATGTERVELSNDASASVVIADAVKFESIGEPAAEFRGTWADAFNTGFKNATQVDDLVARAVAGNYNAIIPEILAYQDNATSAHGAYWDSDIVPRAPDIATGFDPLGYLVQQAHAAGIEVHPWLVTYRICSSWPPAGNALIAAHPEWVMVLDSDVGTGPQKVSNYYVLDPGCPAVQDYLISIVREIVNNYAVDGLHWDYIRYTDADAGYPAYTWSDDSGLARFQQITGYVGIPPSDNTAWCDFRRRGVTELVRRSQIEVATADNPRQPLRQTAAVVTWGNPPTNFTGTSSYSLYQNWEDWTNRGYIDGVVPMAYFAETEYPTWYRNWVDRTLDWRHDRHAYIGQALYKNTFSESVAQNEYALTAGADGVVSYSYASTSTSGTDWSWYPYAGTTVFSTLAVPPSMPWRDPALTTRGVVYGRVTDGVTGAPIDNAPVYLNGFHLGDTDGNGFYVLTKISAGVSGTIVPMSASATGYATVARPNVLLERAGFTEANFALGGWLPGDYDVDGDVDELDWARFDVNLTGPDLGPPPAGGDVFDLDADLDVDLQDFSAVQTAFGV